MSGFRLYRRKDSLVWWFDFSINGKRFRRSTGTEDKTKASQLAANTYSEAFDIIRLGAKPSYTIGQAIARFFSEKDHNSIKQENADKRHLHVFMDSVGFDKPLSEIDADVLSAFISNIAVGRKNSTVNRYVATLSCLLNKACRSWKWINSVPAFDRKREAKVRIMWITKEVANKLISILPDESKDPAEFALMTGLRRTNLFALKWSQVDINRKCAWIYPDEAKAGEYIATPLNDTAIEILKRNIGKHKEYVFTYEGQPFYGPTRREWKAALKDTGIDPKFHWHDFRHTWASWHVQNGTSLQELKELGGWHSIDMVLKYAHLNVDHLHHTTVAVEFKKEVAA